MDPNAPNHPNFQEHQLFFQILQWQQQRQQQQQQQQPAPPPPPPPQQEVSFQSQPASMSVGQQIDNMADRFFQSFAERVMTQLESRLEHNLNQMLMYLHQYGGGSSQVQQPQFIQSQGFAAPQYGGGFSGTQQPQYNQLQNFTAPQYCGGASQAQQPQFSRPQGFAAPQYGGAPFATQQPQYNQPQGFVAPQSTAPAAAAPQQWHAGFEAHGPSAFQFTSAERAPSAFLAPPQDGGTPARDQSFPIGMDNGASGTTQTRSECPSLHNSSPSQNRGTYVQPSVEDESEVEEEI